MTDHTACSGYEMRLPLARSSSRWMQDLGRSAKSLLRVACYQSNASLFPPSEEGAGAVPWLDRGSERLVWHETCTPGHESMSVSGISPGDGTGNESGGRPAGGASKKREQESLDDRHGVRARPGADGRRPGRAGHR